MSGVDVDAVGTPILRCGSELYDRVRRESGGTLLGLKECCRTLGASIGLVAAGTDESYAYFIAKEKGYLE